MYIYILLILVFSLIQHITSEKTSCQCDNGYQFATNCRGTCNYSDLSRYTGWLEYGLAVSTNGKLEFTDGSYFQGTFEKGSIVKGQYFYNNSRYTGTFKNNKKHGKGHIVWIENNVFKYMYDGDWVDDKKHGFGSISYPNPHTRYQGEFIHGLKHGSGIINVYDGWLFPTIYKVTCNYGICTDIVSGKKFYS